MYVYTVFNSQAKRCDWHLMKHRKRKQKMKYVYKIRGYDKLFGEDYWLPEVYETYEQAFKYCKTNESVIRVSA